MGVLGSLGFPNFQGSLGFPVSSGFPGLPDTCSFVGSGLGNVHNSQGCEHPRKKIMQKKLFRLESEIGGNMF